MISVDKEHVRHQLAQSSILTIATMQCASSSACNLVSGAICVGLPALPDQARIKELLHDLKCIVPSPMSAQTFAVPRENYLIKQASEILANP